MTAWQRHLAAGGEYWVVTGTAESSRFDDDATLLASTIDSFGVDESAEARVTDVRE